MGHPVVEGLVPATADVDHVATNQHKEIKSAFASSAWTTVTPDNTGYDNTGVNDHQLSDDAGVTNNSALRTGSLTDTAKAGQTKSSFLDTLTIEGTKQSGESEQAGDNTELKHEEAGLEHNDALSSGMDTKFDQLAAEGSQDVEGALQKQAGLEGRQHHLLRHSLPSEQRGTSVLSHFGVDTVADAAKLIKKMSQRDLQAKFRAVYGTKTFSNNNNWLRRKLFEAIGMDPGKSSTKKAGVGGQRRRRTTKPAAPKVPSRYSRRSRAETEQDKETAAEALLALADVAHMSSKELDGVVPGRDNCEPGWTSAMGGESRDVPIARQASTPGHMEIKYEEKPHLPAATPLHDNSMNDFAANMMEYISQIQRQVMQSPEFQHAAMMSMMGHQPNSPQQQQFMQQVQQAQMAMMMNFQANPAAMHAMMGQAGALPHMQMFPDMYMRMAQECLAAHQGAAPALFGASQSGTLQGSYPDFGFMPGNTRNDK